MGRRFASQCSKSAVALKTFMEKDSRASASASGARVFRMGLPAVHPRLIDRELRGKVGYLFAHTLLHFCVADICEDIGDPAADLFHLGFAHAARGDGWAAQTDAASLHGRKRVEGNRIFVH